MTLFRHNCKIDGCYLDGRFDPALFDELIPGRSDKTWVSLINGDAWCEVNWCFLFIEWKKQGERPMEKGQREALNVLAQQPNTTVLKIEELNNQSYKINWLATVPVQEDVVTLHELKLIVKAWGEKARANGAREWRYV